MSTTSAAGLRLLADMLRIRRLEEKCAELYSAEKIRGFLHLYIGEEANAVGVMQALTPDDAVVATYRERFEELLQTLDNVAFKALDERLLFYLKRHYDVSGSKLDLNHRQIADELDAVAETLLGVQQDRPSDAAQG